MSRTFTSRAAAKVHLSACMPCVGVGGAAEMYTEEIYKEIHLLMMGRWSGVG